MNLQDATEDIHKIYAIKTILEAGMAKCEELNHNGDPLPTDFVMALLDLQLDAAKKLANMRWTDSAGIGQGTQLYIGAIKNL